LAIVIANSIKTRINRYLSDFGEGRDWKSDSYYRRVAMILLIILNSYQTTGGSFPSELNLFFSGYH